MVLQEVRSDLDPPRLWGISSPGAVGGNFEPTGSSGSSPPPPPLASH